MIADIARIDRSRRRFSGRILKAKNRQERYKKGYVLLEGKRLIGDAIQAGADLLTIYTTDRQILDVSIRADAGADRGGVGCVNKQRKVAWNPKQTLLSLSLIIRKQL